MSELKRSQLIDGLRATAVIAMMVYHFGWDLGEFGFVDRVAVNTGYWKIFAQLVGVSFLMISGLSFWIFVAKGLNLHKFFTRFAILLGAALAVTVGTRIFAGDAFVFFGILHLLAACSIMGLLIFRFPSWSLFCLAISLVLIPQYFASAFYEPRYLSWTGLYNSFTGSVDFYGFMPWSAAYVFGFAFAKLWIGKRKDSLWSSSNVFSESNKNFISQSFFWIGRNSLLVYIIHQPILIGLIYSFQVVMDN